MEPENVEKQEKIEEKQPILLPEAKTKDMTAKWIIGVAAVAVLVLGAWGAYEMNKNSSMDGMNTGQNQNPNAIFKTITIGTAILTAEIADTPDKLTQGLSGRISMASSSAMLFEFTTSERYEFWMKDMHFPLDFIWVDQNMKVADITKNVEADTYPQLYAPKSAVIYVIEVNAGYADANKIKIGDTLTIQ